MTDLSFTLILKIVSNSRYQRVLEQLRSSPERWLVTGAAGFIGSHIAATLLRCGQDVVAFDNLSTGSKANLEYLQGLSSAGQGSLTIHEADLRDKDRLLDAMRRVRYVSHQAALGSVPRSLAHPDQTHANNVEGTVNLLLAARFAGVESISYASSSSVYGDHPALPKREDEIGSPLSPYALSKRVCEEYALNYHRCFDLPSIGLRYFNVFGPRQSPDGPYAAVIPRWIDALRKGERPLLFGDGLTSRDFCPVANVVQANILACLAPADSFGRVYNIALGGQTTLIELFAALRGALAQRGVPCEHLEPVYQGFRPGDVRHSRADIRLAQERLGYDPEVGFEAGVDAIFEERAETDVRDFDAA